MGGLMSGVEKSIDANINDIFIHASNVIVNDIHELNDDFYEGYQWIACLDSSTCLACAELDNKIVKSIGDFTSNHDEPPLHFNCRCIIVPVLEGMSNDPSQTKLNYKDWFDEQHDSVKLDILGPSRYNEDMNGKEVTFFAKDGRVMSIDELGIDRTTRMELFIEKLPMELYKNIDEDYGKELANIIRDSFVTNTPVKYIDLPDNIKNIISEKAYNEIISELKMYLKNNISKDKDIKDIINWKSITNKKEISSKLSEITGSYINISKINDIEIQQNIAKRIEFLFSQYHGLKNKINSIVVNVNLTNAYADVIYNENTKEIKLQFGRSFVYQDSLFGDKKDQTLFNLFLKYNKDVSNNYHPKGTNAINIIDHEIAHILDWRITEELKKQGKLKTYKMYSDYLQDMLYKKIIKEGKSYDFLIENISKYSKKNGMELIAEAFTMANGSLPSKYAKWVKDMIEKELLELNWI